MLDDLSLTSDHHAISPFKTPHATARSNVHLMYAPRSEIRGATNVVDVVGVAAVNQNIACIKKGQQVGDLLIYNLNYARA
jgi:hypothetical protein